jgi:hypothetical protein
MKGLKVALGGNRRSLGGCKAALFRLEFSMRAFVIPSRPEQALLCNAAIIKHYLLSVFSVSSVVQFLTCKSCGSCLH